MEINLDTFELKITPFLGKSDSEKIIRSSKGKNVIDFPNDFFMLDLETTGLDPSLDEVIEVSAVKVSNGAVIDSFSTLVKPSFGIPDFITDLTGISDDMVCGAPDMANTLPNVVDFIGDGIVVGHNVGFDINFIYDLCMEQLNKPFTNDYVDTMRISRKLLKELPHHRLVDLVHYFGIESPGFHRSLNDCYSTLEVLRCLKQEALRQHSTIDSFISACRYIHPKLDARELSTDKVDFDESHPLYNRTCVFTGTLEKMKRQDAMQLVLDFGGKCGNNVTKDTNFLILGNLDYCSTLKDGKSSKHKKADELLFKGFDIQVISENVFYGLINS